MEHFDAAKAKRVWDRVQGRSQPPAQDWSFSELISIKAQTAAIYQRLSRYYRGNQVLQNFARQEQAHIAMLSGLNQMQTGSFPTMYTPQSRVEPVKSLLQQCYGYKLRLLGLYEKFSDSPYEGILGQFIPQEQTQCRYLLKLLNTRK